MKKNNVQPLRKLDEKAFKKALWVTYFALLFCECFFAYFDKNRKYAMIFVLVCAVIQIVAAFIFILPKATPMYKLHIFAGYSAIFKAFIYAIFVASTLSSSILGFFLILGLCCLIIFLIILYIESTKEKYKPEMKPQTQQTATIGSSILIALSIFLSRILGVKVIILFFTFTFFIIFSYCYTGVIRGRKLKEQLNTTHTENEIV